MVCGSEDHGFFEEPAANQAHFANPIGRARHGQPRPENPDNHVQLWPCQKTNPTNGFPLTTNQKNGQSKSGSMPTHILGPRIKKEVAPICGFLESLK
jgi:hypothetical protein